MKLYKFFWDCGRMGSVEGLFAANPKTISDAIGKEVYFGEILGKHSEIFGPLNEKDLEEIPIEESAVEKIVSVTGTSISGYNPLDYLSEEE